MGDLQVCSPRHHGILLGGDFSFPHLSRVPFPTLDSDPSLISSENWSRAENIAGDILRRIQPTLVAEQKRQEVIEFVQGLIRSRIGCEVYPYGSVPLKTYLPDGDIDLTAICCANIESAVVSDVYAVLKEQEINGASQFEVNDVHCIDAEVKLVKCIVQNIVVDISFNQLGGLSTVCFLEQVDRLAGKNHLFKQSIILLKAWCYYESRVLGAHHGLISTYALETLVLYIFHFFHGSLHSPLAVLYRFLEYFSIFDWEKYCISLHGPVCKSSLPDIVAETPENGGHELLLSGDFLMKCSIHFSTSSGRSEPSLKGFTLKHLNIIDPLKENNNLGRSVSRGNFFRIRSAFRYGARKLGWILLLPEERMEAELKKFFVNTLDRHCWTNAEFPTISNQMKKYFQDKACLEATLGIRDEKTSGTEASFSNISSTGCKFTGNVRKLETAVALDTSGSNDTPALSSSLSNQINATVENSYCASQKGFLGRLGSQMTSDRLNNKGVCFTLEVENKDEGFNERCNGDTRSVDDVGKLLDLCGDYGSCFKNLRYSQICDRYSIPPPAPAVPLSPPMSPHSQRNYPWLAGHQSRLRNLNVPAVLEQKGFAMGLKSNTVNHISTVFEEKKRPQGIGTYFPKTSVFAYRDWQSQGNEKSQGQVTRSQLQRQDSSNQLPATPQELNIYAEGGLEFSEAEFPALGNGKTGSSSSPPLSYISRWKTPHGNNDSWPQEELDPCPIHPEPCEISQASNPSEQVTSHLPGSSTSGIESSATEGESNQERVVAEPFHLKNNEDFPPLSH